MIFESHAHYDDPKFNHDREALFKKMTQAGIDHIVNIGADMNSSRVSIELAKKYPFIYAAVGVHPHDVQEMKEEHLETLIHFAAYEKVVAIGEIGLDYYYDNSPREIQKLWFREQLKVAKELGLPVVIHSRDAASDTYEIIKDAELGQEKGVIHCYSGSVEMARKYVEDGFYLGIGGVLTFKKSKTIKEVVEDISLDHLLVETDAPYLAPEPHRGKRNDSTYLVHVIQKIAEIKGITPEEVESVTHANAMRLFFSKQENR